MSHTSGALSAPPPPEEPSLSAEHPNKNAPPRAPAKTMHLLMASG